jgi:endonuclease/exonuclease/phosphatase (EEP) superfamily protein YafD
MNRALTIGFWNLQNLFGAKAHPKRGPQSPQELAAKLDALANVIKKLATTGPPDVLVVAEVATRALARRLSRRLTGAGRHARLVFARPTGNDTGLAVLGLTPNVAGLTRLAVEARGHRPRALSVKVTLAVSSDPLYVIGCHWKSDLSQPGQPSPQRDRELSGRWLQAHLSQANQVYPNGKVDPVVVLGDFNAEPYSRALRRELHATRHYTKSLGAHGVRLMNCMWPWLVDAGASAILGLPVNADGPRPLTSFGDGEPAILDQLLVSRSILRGDYFFLEGFDYHRDADTARVLPQLRHVVPNPWTWDATKRTGSGTSDHFPLVVNLRY